MVQDKSRRSIMKIISEMVRNGEPEDRIIKTLRELGIGDDEARRLLLVAQAQTFDLLKNEIGKIVESQISKENTALKEMITSQATQTAKERIVTPEVEEMVAPDLKSIREEPEKKTGESFFSKLLDKILHRKKSTMLPAPKPKKIMAIKTRMITPKETEKPVFKPAEKPEIKAGKPEKKELFKPGTRKPLARQKAITETIPLSEKEIMQTKKKTTSLEAWQTRYKKTLAGLKKKQKRKKLTEKEIAKKVQLAKKIRSYGLKIGKLKKQARTRKKIVKQKKAAREQREKISGASQGELKTMKELAQAAKAITMAAERIVKTAPRPKIVVQGNEEILSLEQQIGQTKQMMKRLETDFYKRRIALPEFQKRMIEYQSKLYELEEKKKIIETTKRTGKPEKRISKKLAKTLEKKLQGKISSDKLEKIEGYLSSLLKNKNADEKDVENKIKSVDSERLLASLEKIVTMAALEREARQAIEESRRQSPTIVIGAPSAEVEQAKQILRTEEIPQAIVMGAQQSVKKIRERHLEKKKEGPSAIPEVLRRMQRRTPRERVIIIREPAQVQQPQTIRAQAPQAKLSGKSVRTPSTVQQAIPAEKPVFEPAQKIAAKPGIKQRFPAEEKEKPKEVIREIIREKAYTSKTGGERKPVKETARETEEQEIKRIVKQKPKIEEEMEFEKPVKKVVRIRPIGDTTYARAPSKPIRVLAEPEKTWSEAEIPSYPETAYKKEKEKLKTQTKHIKRYEIVTTLDNILQKIKEKGIVTIKGLSEELKIDKKKLQELIKILEENKLIKIEYTTFGDEKVMDINYKKPEKKKNKKKQNKK